MAWKQRLLMALIPGSFGPGYRRALLDSVEEYNVSVGCSDSIDAPLRSQFTRQIPAQTTGRP